LKIEERPAEVLVVRPRKKRVRPLLTFFAILALCVMAAIVAGLLPRLRREKALEASVTSEETDKRVVNVAVARQAPTNSALELPSDLQAEIETPIFARADGYLTKRYVDIGEHVAAGQVMAEIETPELDQQIEQARATLANSKSGLVEAQSNQVLASANLKLSQKTLERWQQLEGKGTVSHQEADEKGATRDVQLAQVDAAQAKIASAHEMVSANEANLRRLDQLKAYSKVTAPFTGVVTSRTVDVGTLINAGNGGVSKEMFRVAQTNIMRVFVNVPQAYVGSIKPGVPAELRVQELPGQVFRASVARITGAIDPGSRSMLAIVVIPNPNGVLKPGMYSQVRFDSARSLPALLIPGDALVSGAKGTQVAVVDHSDIVHFRDVKVGTDLGSEVEVVSGLAVGDRVVTNPSDAVHDGTAVEVHQAPAKN
jgi:RND family efflux transporter MFP subunit